VSSPDSMFASFDSTMDHAWMLRTMGVRGGPVLSTQQVAATLTVDGEAVRSLLAPPSGFDDGSLFALVFESSNPGKKQVNEIL
jgi:hypothetical protein